MRILVVDELCYPQLGGQQVRFKELAEQWVLAGHDVTITAIDHTGVSPQKEVINGVNYHRLICDADYYKSGLFGRKISTILRYSFKIRPYLLQNWDLIVFNQFPMIPQLFYKYFYKKRSPTALDFVEHRTSALWRIINKAIINAADKVICISNHVKNCASQYGNNELYVIPSLVNTTNSQSLSKTNYIFLGRLEQHKHPDHAIEAVIEYNKVYNKSAQINVVGGGKMLEPLKNTFGENPFVKFLGNVEDAEKREVLANGRILILPSEREGLPKVVIEAMAYGIPTITTNYSGNGTQFFVTEEKIGLVAEPNITSITEKLNELENNYDYYADRCEAIKKDYDLALNSKRYLDIINHYEKRR